MAFTEPLDHGADWSAAELVVIAIHGHGQTPAAMRALADAIEVPGVRYLFPQAENGTWFPKSLMAPLEENEPQASASIAHYASVVDTVLARDIPLERIVLGGFAEGASLTAEYLTRRPRGYGGAFILTGGMLDASVIGKRPGGGLLAVPVYVTASETDMETPIDRIRGTIRTLQAGGALITSHIFPDRPKLISQDEVSELRKLLEKAKAAAAAS